MFLRTVQALFVFGTALGLSSCGGDPLDYETAMTLLRDRTSDPVRSTFSATPHFESLDPKVVQAYQKLIDAHVIQCRSSAAVGTLCEPGAAGDAITQTGVSDLALAAGRWTPSAIIAIRRTGRNSASADVRMTFEPSTIFQEFEEALDEIQTPVALLSLTTRKQGKVAQATFQRYDDGWHLESVE